MSQSVPKVELFRIRVGCGFPCTCHWTRRQRTLGKTGAGKTGIRVSFLLAEDPVLRFDSAMFYLGMRTCENSRPNDGHRNKECAAARDPPARVRR